MASRLLPLLFLGAALLLAAPVLAQHDAHELEEESAGSRSPLLKHGEAWETDFPVEGVITYHCMPHDAQMSGQVIVSASDPRAVERATVTIRDFSFDPAVVYVKPGGRVNWTNEGEAEHDVMFIRFEAGAPPSDDHASTPFPSALLVAGAVGLLAVAFRLRRGA